MGIQSIQITSSEGKSCLFSMRENGGVVAFLGSAVSIWHPSNIPAGQMVTEALSRILANNTISSSTTIRHVINRSAFEHILERCPKTDLLRDAIAEMSHLDSPNDVHNSFARLIKEGIVDHIITTNYDTGLEEACRDVCCSSSRLPQVVTVEGDARKIDYSSPVIFKIHGCSSLGKRGSMVYTLKREAELKPWKRDLLHLLIKGKKLLVCGYSGLDFEICPELPSSNPGSVYWNTREDPGNSQNRISGNAQRVLNAVDGIALVGDMRKMLCELDVSFNAWPEIGSSKKIDNFIRSINGGLNKWELDEWRAGLYVGIGCALDGINISKRMLKRSGLVDKRKLDSLLYYAQSLFHRGLYMESTSVYCDAAVIAKKIDNDDKYFMAELGVIESNRCAGHWIKAWKGVTKISRIIDFEKDHNKRKNMESSVSLKRLLLLHDVYQFVKIIPILGARIKDQAKLDLALVAKQSSGSGNWFDLQQCKMWSEEKFSIPFSDIYSGPMPPLSPEEGYRQLGYIVAEMMSIRNSFPRKKMTHELRNTIRKYSIISFRLGTNPELWKFLYSSELSYGKKVLPKVLRGSWKYYWNNCEYTFLMKYVHLARIYFCISFRRLFS